MEALRFQRLKIEKIYFPQYLTTEFKNSRYPIPENIKKARNTAIILGVIELFCCIASFFLYEIRRSRIIISFLIVNLLATCFGFYQKLRLSYWGLLAHATYTISIIGGFYIYIFFDYFMTRNQDDQKSKGQLSQTIVLIISSLPLLGLFGMGIYSCYIVLKLDDEFESRRKNDRQRQETNINQT